MTSTLSGKVALVTGARTGLGAATVLALAGLGAIVVAAGRRPGDCAPLVATAAATGGIVRDRPIDVSNLGAIPGRIDAILQEFGRADILINNAGTIEPMAPIAGLDGPAFDAALRTNVSGPATLVAALWPHLAGGRVINVVSGAANRAINGWAAYCASKAALLMLTNSIALEGAEKGIKAFAFAPGLVNTAMQASIRKTALNEIARIPPDTLLPPERPAAVIAWLAAGAGDDLAGRYLDIREPGLRERVTTIPTMS